jgi:glycosyltransferase involved in cell wall biosynthesis
MNCSLKKQDRLQACPIDESAEQKRPLRVLVVDEEIPYPPNAGKRIRTWNILKRLAHRHTIRLLCYGHPSDPAATIVQKAGITLCLVAPQSPLRGWRLYKGLFCNLFSPYPFSVTKHYSDRYQEKLEELLQDESWDLIHCEWTPYARFIRPRGRFPVLIATHNVESQIWARRAQHSHSLMAKMFLWTQEWKMRRFERRALLRASSVTAVTTHDCETLQAWGVQTVNLVPNGVDLDLYPPARENERDNEILFLGSLDWYPNVDALTYLQDIFALVRARQPKARLRIVGRKPSKTLEKRFSGIPGVDFAGEVDDVRTDLDRAAVVVVPLRIGGGSRLKILEALAAGKAVVCTSIGAEGLDVVSGEHLIIADCPYEFAAGVVELLNSREARRRLGNQGRMLVNRWYGWDGIVSRLEGAWFDVSRSNSPTPSEVRVTL